MMSKAVLILGADNVRKAAMTFMVLAFEQSAVAAGLPAKLVDCAESRPM